MGQRANLVIVRNGEWSLYYDHWCANRLDVDLFWGPEMATAFVEEREPLADRNDWLDEVWCEGGAVIDHDRQVLLWFGAEDISYDVGLRRAFMPLMQRQWPGWEIRWATGAVAELGGYLGIPVSKFLDQEERGRSAGFGQVPETPDENDTLLTVRQDGRTTVTRFYGGENATELGRSHLPTLLSFPREPALEWTGEMAMGGLHIDLDERTMFCWRARPAVAVHEHLCRSWPGWRTEWLADRYEEHLRLVSAQVRFPNRDIAELQRERLGHLRRLCNYEPSNPAREIASMIGATELSPWTDETRGSVGSEAEKLQRLDELEAQVPLV